MGIFQSKFIPILVIVGFLASCSTFSDDGRLSEGVIEYEVTYPKLDPSSILKELLPTKMQLTFKDDEYITDLAAGFGMFRMNVISNNEDRKMAQMVKLINERFVVKYDEALAAKSNGRMPDIRIEHTENTKMIAGYECKEAIVNVLNNQNEQYTIYYTDQIKMEMPNWFTQMADIEGVLLEYQVERYNLCSRFTAVNVTPKEVDDELFEIPEEYREINEEEMENKMAEIFNNFSE